MCAEEGTAMTHREMNRAVFEGHSIPTVLFQPRIEWWYQYNRQRGTLPEPYREMSLLELFDDLGVSIRYFAYATGQAGCLETTHSPEVTQRERVEGERKLLITQTPLGDLVVEHRKSSDGGWRVVRHAIRDSDDLEKAIWLFERTATRFLPQRFEEGSQFVGDRGEPQFFVPRSGYQHLALREMGLEALIYALADVPRKVERLMSAIDRSYDGLYEDIIAYGKVRIVNFGENIDGNIVSPEYFTRYCIPFYKKRSNQLRAAGIHTHIHIDGSFRPLVPLLPGLPFDGLEALTPLPQGDVSLDEMEAAVGEKVLLDGIPAILFLPDWPMAELEACVEKLVTSFHPRLILGASDEVPPPADIERVRWVAEFCRLNPPRSSRTRTGQCPAPGSVRP